MAEDVLAEGPLQAGSPLRTPRAASVAGIIFSVLLITALVLLRISAPAHPGAGSEWLTDSGKRAAVAVALNLVPFAGIAFLWFIGVLRDRIGEREDRFFATVFLGSGLLFVAMMFAAAAVAGAIIAAAAVSSELPGAGTLALSRNITNSLLNVYAMRMAAVFTLTTVTIARRTQIVSRWLTIAGFACALVLLIGIGISPWAELVFPAWILALSLDVLLAGPRASSAERLAATSNPSRLPALARILTPTASSPRLVSGNNRGVGDLPAGAVTMLFSDIEGSTALLSRLGDRYGQALSDHRAVLRAAFGAWHGREMDTQGDSFFVVFETAADAVACCLAAQRALAAHDWPGGDAVRVRMGLHSGEPTRHEDGYIGMDVHRAARIAATAHGGQVVLSEVTLQQAGPLPEGASVRDLGFHRLKDISAPERIYQLAGPGLWEDFPALKSLGTHTSLPVPATPLVGRDDDLERLLAVIARPDVRLVTLSGPGGVGKTRLSLAAAATLDHAFPHGVFFVALAAVRDAALTWKTLAGELDVDGDGQAAVLEYLRNRRMLLVLDNLEQLDGAGEVVAALAGAAPGLVVLATSRGPLYVQGEYEFPVPPLDVARGADVDTVAASAAVRLFAQQAAMVRPGFAITADNAADVAAICRRLDGLPLAIELAASRVRLLAPKALLARLGQSLGLATAEAGRPSRQQTLRNLVAWSYDLLTPDTAQVFRRMSVFAGGCDLDALAAVAVTSDADPDPLDLIAELHDVSLITVTEGADGEPRLGLLETIREYALDRLEADDDVDGARYRHADYYAGLAERASEQIDSPAQLTALDRLEAEHDNLRAALAWSLQTPAADPARQGERAVIGLRLVQALATFWYQHGHATEGRQWLQRAMDLASGDGGAPLARVAHGLGVLMDQQGEPDAARRMFERSLAIWRELGDRGQQARQLNSLGITYRHLGQLAKARAFLEEAVALNRETGNMVTLADSLANLGQLESSLGRWDRAMVAVQEALLLDRQYGSPFGVAVDQSTLALATLRSGRPREARDLVGDMLDYVASSGNTAFFVNTLELAAVIVGALDDHPLAARLLGAAQTARQDSGMPLTQPEAALIDELLTPAYAAVTPQEWDAWLAAGRALSQPEALALLRSLGPA